LGRRTDRQAIILADDLEQLVLVLAQVGQVVHLDAIVLEDLDGGGAELVGNENLGHWGSPLKIEFFEGVPPPSPLGEERRRVRGDIVPGTRSAPPPIRGRLGGGTRI